MLGSRVYSVSSYIDVVHPERHAPYLDIPDDVIEYLHYLDFVKLRSPRTVNGYYLDLRGFFRFMMVQRWDRADAYRRRPISIVLTGITTEDIAQTITKRDIFQLPRLRPQRRQRCKGARPQAERPERLFSLYAHTGQQADGQPD